MYKRAQKAASASEKKQKAERDFALERRGGEGLSLQQLSKGQFKTSNGKEQSQEEVITTPCKNVGPVMNQPARYHVRDPAKCCRPSLRKGDPEL